MDPQRLNKRQVSAKHHNLDPASLQRDRAHSRWDGRAIFGISHSEWSGLSLALREMPKVAIAEPSRSGSLAPARKQAAARADSAHDRRATPGLCPGHVPAHGAQHPVLLGGILSWMVSRRSEFDDNAKVKARTDRGVLIASGLIAGGAIIGAFDAIAAAIVKQVAGTTDPKNVIHNLSDHAFEGIPGEVIAIITLVALCSFVVMFSRKAKA